MKYSVSILLLLIRIPSFSQTENRKVYTDSLNSIVEIKDTCHIDLSWYPKFSPEYLAWLDTTDIMIDIFPYADCKKEECRLTIKPTCPCVNFQVTYFNRWGEVLYQSDQPENGWYAYNEPDGVYIWQLKGMYETGQQFKHHGHVTLLH